MNRGGLEITQEISGVVEGGGMDGDRRKGMNGGLPRRIMKRDDDAIANGFNGYNGLNSDDEMSSKELDAMD